MEEKPKRVVIKIKDTGKQLFIEQYEYDDNGQDEETPWWLETVLSIMIFSLTYQIVGDFMGDYDYNNLPITTILLHCVAMATIIRFCLLNDLISRKWIIPMKVRNNVKTIIILSENIY